MVNAKRYVVYMLHCRDGSLYTGITDDLKKRLQAHNAGKGAKYTRSRLPVTVACFWEVASKELALHWEWKIKKLRRKQKIQLLAQKKKTDAPLEDLLP